MCIRDSFQPDDTLILYYHTLTSKNAFLDLKLRGGLTLPISKASVDTDNVTKTSLMVQMSKEFFNKKLSISYRPYFTYYVNEFTSSPDGNPLRQASLGNWVLSSYKVTSEFSLNLTFQSAFHWNQKSPFASTAAPKTGSYLIEPYLRYDVNDNISTRLGYSHSDRYTKSGRYEINLYDPEVSRVFLAVDLSI